MLKRRYQAFPAHKQACTNLTGPPQRWKLLSQSSLVLKQDCTCFKAPPRMLKRLYQAFPAHKQACTNLTGPPQWWKLLCRYALGLTLVSTCFTALPRRLKRVFPSHKKACTRLMHSASTVVKTAFSIFPGF